MKFEMVISRDQVDGGRRQEVIDRAYARFAQDRPEWVSALFDDFFLAHFAAGALNDPAGVEPLDLARAWADQFGTSREGKRRSQRRAMPAATEFVRLLRAELAGETAGVPVQEAFI